MPAPNFLQSAGQDVQNKQQTLGVLTGLIPAVVLILWWLYIDGFTMSMILLISCVGFVGILLVFTLYEPPPVTEHEKGLLRMQKGYAVSLYLFLILASPPTD